MLKIISSDLLNNNNPDFVLENQISLYDKDWDKNKYLNGFDAQGNATGKEYYPVYSSNNEDTEDNYIEYDLIGFMEI